MNALSQPPARPWLRASVLLALTLPPGIQGALQLATALPLNSVDTALTGLILCSVVSALIAGWTFGASCLLRFATHALVPASLVTIILLLLNGAG